MISKICAYYVGPVSCVFSASHITDAAGENAIGLAKNKFQRKLLSAELSRSANFSVELRFKSKCFRERFLSPVASSRCCDLITSLRKYLGTWVHGHCLHRTIARSTSVSICPGTHFYSYIQILHIASLLREGAGAAVLDSISS